MKRLLCFLFIGIFFGLHTFAFAQIKLNTHEVKLEVTPGEDFSGFVMIENGAVTPVVIKTHFEDLTYPAPFNGSKSLLPLGSTAFSCGKWITVSPSSFVIPARSKQKVGYTIKVPKEAKGGYYAVLLFEKSAEQSAGVGIALRLGYSFLIETKDILRQAEIKDISLNKDKIQGTLLNSGNVLLVTKGTFHIMEGKGQITERGDISKFYLLPKEKTSFSVNTPKKMNPGTYTLMVNFDLEKGNALVKEIDFSRDESGNLKIMKIKD